MNPLLLILLAFAGWEQHLVVIEGQSITVWTHSSGLVMYNEGGQ